MQDHAHLAVNLRAYINGFSDNKREVLEKFSRESEHSKIFATTAFGYRKITVEAPCGSISRPAPSGNAHRIFSYRRSVNLQVVLHIPLDIPLPCAVRFAR